TRVCRRAQSSHAATVSSSLCIAVAHAQRAAPVCSRASCARAAAQVGKVKTETPGCAALNRSNSAAVASARLQSAGVTCGRPVVESLQVVSERAYKRSSGTKERASARLRLFYACPDRAESAHIGPSLSSGPPAKMAVSMIAQNFFDVIGQAAVVVGGEARD